MIRPPPLPRNHPYAIDCPRDWDNQRATIATQQKTKLVPITTPLSPPYPPPIRHGYSIKSTPAIRWDLVACRGCFRHTTRNLGERPFPSSYEDNAGPASPSPPPVFQSWRGTGGSRPARLPLFPRGKPTQPPPNLPSPPPPDIHRPPPTPPRL